jgi:hypothetical protein
MTFREKVVHTFAQRAVPTVAVAPEAYKQFDSDVEEALWFANRDWRSITWNNWRDRYAAIFFLSPAAFAYYVQSLLCLTAENPADSLLAADAIIHALDRSPNTEGWDESFRGRYTHLIPAELGCLEEWLLILCEYPAYRSYGNASGGPGDTFGRAIDTITLLKKEAARS